MDAIERRIRDSFASQGFLRTLGAELLSVGPGVVEVRLPVRDGLLQQHGYVHGGAVGTIADTAAGYAAMTTATDGDMLTAEFKIHFLAPAVGDWLVARARVLRAGRRLTVAACDVFAVAGETETCMATLLGTFVRR